MLEKTGYDRLLEDWKRYESRRFFTSDGASSYERAKETCMEMGRPLEDGRYRITDIVSVAPDYFPRLTDSLDDGLIYEMGFTLLIRDSDVGRLSRFELQRPDKVTFYTESMAVTVRPEGLYLKKGRQGRRWTPTGRGCAPYGAP